MDIVITGRHVTVSDRFREHVERKLDKVTQLAPRARRVEVMVSHEANRRQAKACDRVEITCYDKGPVIRAEACQDDRYAALDVALDKLYERLRRIHDRKRVQRRGGRAPESVAQAMARIEPLEETSDEVDETDAMGDSPIEVREKVHISRPMTLDDALREMELVGHDFYLFHDSETDKASVVYRRRGWSYGVLHLELEDAPDGASGQAVDVAADEAAS